MSLGSRIKERRESLGMTQVQLAELLGVTKGAIGNYETDANSPKASILYKVFEVLHCDANYLFQDEIKERREFYASPWEMENIIKKYRTLDRYGKDAVSAILSVEHQRCEDRPQHDRSNLIPLPRSVQSVSAGTGAYLGPEEMETVFVEDTPLTRRASFLVSVAGNSMEPRYHDGDVLIVEGAEDLALGEIGVFTVSGDGYVKQRGRGVLISLNPDYSPVPMTEDTWCNGRVIGVLGKDEITEA